MLQEGKTGTDPNGVRVIVRGGKIVPLAQADNMAATGRLAPGGPVMNDAPPEREALVAIRDGARKAQDVAAQADQFLSLNRKTGTGGLRSLKIPFTNMGVGSIVGMNDPNWNDMESITSKVAPAMRTPGAGSSSDLDIKMFKQSFPNVDNLGPTNTKIRDRLRAEATEKAAYADFADQWFAQNGTLLGADVAWRKQKTAAKAAPAPSSGGFKYLGPE